ncbi:MAG: alpha-E domain-containing protein [Phycisphaerales bacterium]|nr:alpha-E domain-containing protein [Phycisphaerales bacterium]
MSRMLARAAENMYWMGRYLERSAGLCRKLEVARNVAVEVGGLDPDATLRFLQDMALLYPGSGTIASGQSVHETLESLLDSYLLGHGNDLSVAVSLRAARENARAVRDYLSREVFESINGAWLNLSSSIRSKRDPDLVLPEIQQRVFGIGGAMGRTMLRDESWAFMDLGVMLERIHRVLYVVAHRLPAALGDGTLAIPVQVALLRGVLRSGASLENYRRVRGVELDPAAICGFLLLDRHAPHSVAYGIRVMESALEDLGSTEEGSEARRRAGLLSARLRYGLREPVDWKEKGASCLDIADEILQIHEALTRQYFAV